MTSFFIDIFRRNIYLLLAAFVLFFRGYLLNVYFSSDASVTVLRNSIESLLQERQKDFGSVTGDTALIHRFLGHTYSRTDLEKFAERKYGLFLYTPDTAGDLRLVFWSDQRSLPTPALLDGRDSTGFIQLSNGQYDFMRRTVPDSRGRQAVAVALIPVRWQYYISNPNLTPEFVDNLSAEDRVQIVATPTDFPVRDSRGEILFYLQKKPGYHAPAHNWPIPFVILLGPLLLLIIIHNIAHSVRENWGVAWGIGFLVTIIILLRFLIYASPDLLNLRQFELFDPTIYGSSIILNSLGDLVINAFLLCWIVMFIRREVGDYTIPQ